jgi:hypothetical protein
VSENCKEFVNLSRLAEEPIPFFAFEKQFFLEHFDAMFLVVIAESFNSLRSCRFLEREISLTYVLALGNCEFCSIADAWRAPGESETAREVLDSTLLNSPRTMRGQGHGLQ